MPWFGKKSFEMQLVLPSVEQEFPAVPKWSTLENAILISHAEAVSSLASSVPDVISTTPKLGSTTGEVLAFMLHYTGRLVMARSDAETLKELYPYLENRLAATNVDLFNASARTADEQQAREYNARLLQSSLRQINQGQAEYAECEQMGLDAKGPPRPETVVGVFVDRLGEGLGVAGAGVIPFSMACFGALVVGLATGQITQSVDELYG